MDAASAGVAFATFAFQVTTYLIKFTKEVKNYNSRVDELVDKIETLAAMIKMAAGLIPRLKSTSGSHGNLSEALSMIEKCIRKSESILRTLTGYLGKFGAPLSLSMFEKVFKHLCYETGGKSELESALKDIEGQINQISWAKGVADTHLGIDLHKLSFSRENSDNSAKAQSVTSEASETRSMPPFGRTDTWASQSSFATTISSFSTSETLCGSIAPSLSPDLISAIQQRDPKLVHAKLKGAQILDKDADGCCALHHALRAGSKRVLLQLLKSKQVKGVSGAIDEPDRSGATALHYAASAGNLDLAEELLRAGANIDRYDYQQRSPLDEAVKRGREDFVEFLLDRGAKPLVAKDLRPKLEEMQGAINYRNRQQEKEARKMKAR